MVLRKKDGFAGQVSVVVPENIRAEIRQNKLINSLYLTDIGYYPLARHHYRERTTGADEYILIYVLGGSGIVRINEQDFAIGANQYIIIPEGIRHSYQADEEDPWTIYWVHFTGTNSRMMDSISGKAITIAPSEISRIGDRIRLFDEIIDNLSLGFSPDNIEYANMCLMHLLASFKYVNQFRKINYSTEKDIIKKATLYMKQNVNKSLKLKDLASQFNLSTSHFSRMFSKRTRHSPVDYFIRLKMQHACQLLDYSQLRIYEIGREIGYDDPYYFSRVFTKMIGVSPSKYRLKK